MNHIVGKSKWNHFWDIKCFTLKHNTKFNTICLKHKTIMYDLVRFEVIYIHYKKMLLALVHAFLMLVLLLEGGQSEKSAYKKKADLLQ